MTPVRYSGAAAALRRARSAALPVALLGAILTGAAARPAWAQTAAPAGRITLSSPGGSIRASLLGWIRFDGALMSPDAHSPLGISEADANHSGFFFRSAFVLLLGNVGSYAFAFSENFADATDPAHGLSNVWIAHRLGAGGTLYLGQHKPWRSLDDQATFSSIPFLERNVLSANGLYQNRFYGDGLFYDWAHRGMLRHGDNLWLGGAFYSNTRAGLNTGGYGLNGRVAYAPLIQARRWVHVGLSYSYDESPTQAPRGPELGYGPPSAGDSHWYGAEGSGVDVAKFGPGPASSESAVAGELAATFGPLYLQGEYGHALMQQASRQADINAYSISVAWAITGESRPYRPNEATYGVFVPAHRYGAWELAARYDRIQNGDLSTCALSPRATRCEVSTITVGLNYYLSSNARVTLDYMGGTADAGVAGSDRPSTVEARAELAF